MMKTIHDGRIMGISNILWHPKDPSVCKVKLDIYMDGSWSELVEGCAWNAIEKYKDNPLFFIPFPASDRAKYAIINIVEDMYADFSDSVETWAVEYHMFIRMLLDGYLMLNPAYLPLNEILEEILEEVKKAELSSFSVDTPKGKIVAKEMPDDEFPGIELLYENGDGEPGAIMEYTPTHDTIQMRIYSAENPNDEPAEILDMVLKKEEKAKEKYPLDWTLTDNDSLQYQRKIGPRLYRMVEMVWLDTARGDDGYPDRPYTVKSAVFGLDDYSEEDLENEVSCFYEKGLSGIREEYGDDADDIIAECVFENMASAEASTSEMMTKEDAEESVRKYIAIY